MKTRIFTAARNYWKPSNYQHIIDQDNVAKQIAREQPLQLSRNLRKNLVRCLQRPTRDFARLGVQLGGEFGHLIHIDRGCKILGVAHLDTVLSATPHLENSLVMTPTLDDRLGVWVLLHLLPSLGFNDYDILLTDNEERGASTAADFCGKEYGYNWIFEFDRQGTDAVTYHYTDRPWLTALEETFTLGQGSYSDIADLAAGVCGVNVGVGYHRQHSYSCYANLQHTIAQTKLFVEFAKRYYDAKFTHTPKPTPLYQPYSSYVTHDDYYLQDNQAWDHSRSLTRYTPHNLECTCGEFVADEWRYCPYCGSKI
jgi:hypothetical protein